MRRGVSETSEERQDRQVGGALGLDELRRERSRPVEGVCPQLVEHAIEP
jgi:hypothetical protein